jgi:hypothetical protein
MVAQFATPLSMVVTKNVKIIAALQNMRGRGSQSGSWGGDGCDCVFV